MDAGKENDARADAILGCFEALYRTAFRLTGNKAQAEDLVARRGALSPAFSGCWRPELPRVMVGKVIPAISVRPTTVANFYLLTVGQIWPQRFQTSTRERASANRTSSAPGQKRAFIGPQWQPRCDLADGHVELGRSSVVQ
jgi:hypothetical protein